MSIPKKIVLVGHFGVGKTSLMRRFIDNAFSEKYKVTLGVQIQKKVVTLPNGNEVSLIIWDLEGNVSITNTRRSYLLGSQSFLYVFDATRTETFENINAEIEYIKENYPTALVTIIGNKSDLVNNKSLRDVLKNKKVPFDYLTSAKTGDNVSEMFQELAQNLIA